jgi:Na+/phosphate symporter
MPSVKQLFELWKRDNLLNQAMDDSHAMLQRTRMMFRESVKSLRHTTTGEIGFNVYDEDKQINLYEQKVRREVLKHLSITGSPNLVPGLILTSIVIDIERVGDYMKNIVELAAAHPSRLECGIFEEDVQRIEAAVTTLFDNIVAVLEASDKEKARSLVDQTVWIKKRCDQIDHEIIQEKDPNLRAGDAASIALYVRYLKRIGAHLMNILSSVINPFERIGYGPQGQDDT